jgi:hypothetical protein
VSGWQCNDGAAKQDANCDNPLWKCARPAQKARRTAKNTDTHLPKNDRIMSEKDKE